MATFRPTALWSDFPISLDPVVIITIGLLLCYKIFVTIGFRAFFLKYKATLILLFTYFFVCFITLYLNLWRFKNPEEIVRYGVTFILVTASFPAILLLFSLPQNTRGLSLSRYKYSPYISFCYFALLALMVIWQYLDFESSKSVAQYFVSSEVWPSKNVNGFFRISTDVAPVLGLLVIGLSSHFTSIPKKNWNAIAIAVLIILLIAGGISTGSRVFFLMIFASVCVFFIKANTPLRQKLLAVFAGLIFLHIIVMFANPSLVTKLQPFLPYLGPMYNGTPIVTGDFFVNANLQATGRKDIWSGALTFIFENPFFGVTSGGFRLANSELQNTHNFILQILIDAGVIGFMTLCFLVFKIRSQMRYFVIWILMTSLIVDFPLGHSLPYSICIGFIVVNVIGSIREAPSKPSVSLSRLLPLSSSKALITLIGMSLILFAVIYSVRKNDTMEQSLKEKLSRQIRAGAYNKQPILVDGKEFDFNYFKSIIGFPYYLVNTLDDSANFCHYAYLKQKYTSKQLVNWFKPINNERCNELNVDIKELKNGSIWITDRVHRKQNRAWRLTENNHFFSPMVSMRDGPYRFQFAARNLSYSKDAPKLKIVFISNGESIETTKVSIEQTEYRDYQVVFDNLQGRLGYFVVSLASPLRDKANKKHRRVWIKANSTNVVSIY